MAIATRPRKPAADTAGLVIRKHGAHGRSYKFNGDPFVSVSYVKDCMPADFRSWAARIERAHVLGVLEKFLTEFSGDPSSLTPTGIVASVLQACGEKFAWPAELNAAATRGTRVHQAIEHYAARKKYDAGDGAHPGEFPELGEREGISYRKFERWADAVEFMPIASELSVCSPTYRWGGTLDEIALVEGRPTVVDWKQGRSLHDEDRMQVSAYTEGYNEYADAHVPGVEHVDRAALIHIPSETDSPDEATIVTLERDEIATWYDTFLLAVPLAHRLKALEAARKAAAGVAR